MRSGVLGRNRREMIQANGRGSSRCLFSVRALSDAGSSNVDWAACKYVWHPCSSVRRWGTIRDFKDDFVCLNEEMRARMSRVFRLSDLVFCGGLSGVVEWQGEGTWRFNVTPLGLYKRA